MGVVFSRHSGVFTLYSKQAVRISLSRAWDFFSTPKNLSMITPSHMNFEITSSVADKVYSGQIITYKVSVLPGVRLSWVTEITNVSARNFFIDEQRFGPYKMWHHEHFFEEIDAENCYIIDKITYKIPFGILGVLLHRLFIKKQLKSIFEFRSKAISKLLEN